MAEYFSDLLYIYPVKSIAGIPVKALKLNDRGLEFDRFWMLVNENYQMLSQRDFPKLNLLKIFEEENSFKILDPLYPKVMLKFQKNKYNQTG